MVWTSNMQVKLIKVKGTFCLKYFWEKGSIVVFFFIAIPLQHE